MSLEIKGWMAVRNWLSRGWKVQRVWHDKDETFYFITRQRKSVKAPKRFLALFGKEPTCRIN